MKKFIFILFLMFPTLLWAQEVSYTTTGISSDPDITTPQYSSTKAGIGALGSMNAEGDNTSIGNYSLQGLKGIEGYYFNGTTHGNGEHNIAYGSASLQNLDATNCSGLGLGCAAYNVAVGVAALDRVNPTGASGSVAKSNTAIGDHAGAHISYGSYNLFGGGDTGQAETTGTGNTILGGESLTTVGTPAMGNYNTGVGSFGWGNLSSGSVNVGVGDFIYQLLSSGSDNIAIGDGAAGKLTTGDDNVIIGPGVATTTLATGSSNILIGNSNAIDTPTLGTSNWLNIGNTIYGNLSTNQIGIGSGLTGITSGAALDLSSNTSSLLLPVGTTGTRPTEADGMLRYNTTTEALEGGVNGTFRSLPSIVATADATGNTANISAVTIVTPNINTMYRISCMEVLTTAASTSSTLPHCFVDYTDVDSNTAESIDVTPTNTSNTVGSVSTGAYFFYAKSSVAVQIGTTAYTSSASGMTYAVHVKLEQVQ